MGQISAEAPRSVIACSGSSGWPESWLCLLQYLSGKLGIATGHSLPELIRLRLSRPTYILPYWFASEVATVMTDLAEFLGTVIAFNLLFGIPLLYGTFLSVLDVILVMGVTGGRVRRLEYFFMTLW